MARVNVNQIEVLEAIAEHLAQELGLDPRQAYVTLSPENPAIPPGGDSWYAVSPGEGRFDTELATADVREQLNEDTVVSITGYTRLFLDDADRDAQLLLEETRGLLAVKKSILDAMAGADVKLDDGDTFLRELMTPQFASAPQKGTIDPDDLCLPIAWISVDFSCSFDWDLD